jgi:hypothetical protein
MVKDILSSFSLNHLKSVNIMVSPKSNRTQKFDLTALEVPPPNALAILLAIAGFSAIHNTFIAHTGDSLIYTRLH